MVNVAWLEFSNNISRIYIVSGVIDLDFMKSYIDNRENLILYVGPLLKFLARYKNTAIDWLTMDNVYSIASIYYDVGLYKYISKSGGKILWSYTALISRSKILANLGSKNLVKIINSLLAKIHNLDLDQNNLAMMLLTQAPDPINIFKYYYELYNKDSRIYIVSFTPFNKALGIQTLRNLYILSLSTESPGLIDLNLDCYRTGKKHIGLTQMDKETYKLTVE